MFDFLTRLFSKEESSRQRAKDRLRLVLVQDRAIISPNLMEQMRVELLDVVSKYMEIDERNLEFNLERDDEAIALVASIPIRRLKRPGPGSLQ
ncbi:MAG TPA: cell division topological specificity factor MinE [Firmicutes bacterium]|nr:cell division topological specificity factor MinE [Bacillota bacterium]